MGAVSIRISMDFKLNHEWIAVGLSKLNKAKSNSLVRTNFCMKLE